MKRAVLLVLIVGLVQVSFAGKPKKKGEEDKTKNTSAVFGGLKFRPVGPALTAGRVADIAVNPNNVSEYYIAVASGGVWKTENAGTTYEPIFDGENSYSIGCITIDPSNEHILWVGTGENNNQRSVAYGDGVYKSLDGGKSWKNMGLKSSEHIGRIVVHPNNSNIVYVAAYGPLWSKGGERGVYKTIDGGENWELVLEIDEHTGVNEIWMDPRDSDVLYATAHQRRRHVFTYVGGGPGSGIHKSNDGGKTWNKINSGLPQKMGRIGMTISPVDPDYLYAIVEAEDDKGGFFRSTNRGASWDKMSSYKSSGNYYQELVPDLTDKNKVFSMNTWLHHTIDGGKTFVKTGEKSKHVDNHCMWIDPSNSNHWILGCDGGLYETWDHASNWQYKPNLPITQFYKVAVDNDKPFYNIYGGTQDNNSLGGPSRTINNHGIMNQDWVITNGGDGFESAIDPVDPNIVYAQSQYGWLVRYDKVSGESVGIKPMARSGEPALRWNWDAPLIISPHNHKRLYFAANRLFKSDDRGDTWQPISPDLTRQLDRNKMKVMGRVQSIDAVMKNKSTTIFGNIVALDESPVQENLIYAGTDDGLIQVSEDAGQNWRKISSFPNVPEMTYVNAIVCSQYDANTVYAVFNNHKKGDFKPYILKSTDKGASWKNIESNLPERGSVYDIVEDHVNKGLLFAGTEFGVFFSNNGGGEWIQLKAGLPTIAVRDLEIQKRENDLVLATFGRGFYVLDDYSSLRDYNEELSKKAAHIFPIKKGVMFVDARPLGLKGKGSQGESLFTTPNPEVGAVFTYMINDTLRTLKEIRQKKEGKLLENNQDVTYPTINAIHSEATEDKPFILFTIYDEQGDVVRKLRSEPKNGINRIVWDFRYTPSSSIRLKERKIGRYSEPDQGPLALPGKYKVSLSKVEDGKVTELVSPQEFECVWLEDIALPAKSKEDLLAFQQKVEKLRKAVEIAQKIKSQLDKEVEFMKKAAEVSTNVPTELIGEARALQYELETVEVQLNGDHVLSSLEFETPESISSKVWIIISNMWRARSKPSQTSINLYEDAGEELESLFVFVRKIMNEVDLIKVKFNELGVPYTPGRMEIPDWKMD